MDSTAVNYNLRKAHITWGRVSVILKREGANLKTMGNFYKAIVQLILLYARETWQLQLQTTKILESFHHKVASHIRKPTNIYMEIQY
jgi:hypothetical protein